MRTAVAEIMVSMWRTRPLKSTLMKALHSQNTTLHASFTATNSNFVISASQFIQLYFLLPVIFKPIVTCNVKSESDFYLCYDDPL